jgi:Bacteriophage tail sheath protein
MPDHLTYPGVYIEEIPGGVHTIAGVPTSITAFMGRAWCGPLGTGSTGPITVFSFADYERLFGGLWTNSPMSYAVRDYFNNGGSQAIIVRLIEATPPAGLPADAGSHTPPQNYGCAVIDVDAPTATPPKNPAELAPSASPPSSPPVRPAPSSTLPLYAANPGTWGNDIRVMVDVNNITPEVAELYADYGVRQADMFNITIFHNPPGGSMQTERFVGLTLSDYSGFPPNPNRVDRILSEQSQLVQIFPDEFAPVPNTSWSGIAGWATFSSNDFWNYNQQQLFALLNPAGGGDDGESIRSELTYDDPISGGIAALEKVDLFNLLCTPYDTPDEEAAVIQAYPALAQYCQKRRAMFIVDPPFAWSAAAQKHDGNSIQPIDLGIVGDLERNAAVYFPRIVEADPLLNGQPRVMPACGIIAGVTANTDATQGVWKAPAGTEAALNGILNLEVNLTDEQNGMLNRLGINCLRSFPVIGPVVWGARTLRGADQLADDYKYIPVRRLALYVEESLYRGTNWAVFEPNADPLWTSLRTAVNTFLSGLQGQGAFYSYFVRCDNTTTTADDIASGVVNIIVGIAPVKPAEFVVIQIQQLTADQAS